MAARDDLDPLLPQSTEVQSPEQEKALEIEASTDVRERIAQAAGAGPTAIQRTQSEIIDLTLVSGQLGNPFSVRHIPFSILREMTTDMMLAFGWYFTLTPLIRADWDIACPVAKLAAAVDAALRPVITGTYTGFSNSLWYGHQPMVKDFRLGKLEGFYRDPQAVDPDKELPVWTSSADALLWKAPRALNPSHCVPMWGDDGEMTGFKFSATPIPNSDLISAANAYGYTSVPGKEIGSDYAMWIVNERELNFGSVFGSPRTKRAYRIWWSYWFRWALADRSFENLADPAKLVYYPTELDAFIDPDDPNKPNPQILAARQQALDLGRQARAGASLAVPGDLAQTPDGKVSTHRKWEMSYLEAKSHLSDLELTFLRLQTLLLRSWLIPEQAFVESKGETQSRYAVGQLGEVYQESQQLLADQYDEYINEYMIPQFIAANFPEYVGTPCRKKTRGLGAQDVQLRQQILTLIGQVRGDVIPVDIRELLRQSGIPLLSEEQFKNQIKQIGELQAMMGPPERDPEKVGTQGYNAGVVKTPRGNMYWEPPQRIHLSESDGFLNDLPETPHYSDGTLRSSAMRLRRTMLDRYREQYGSFADFLSDQATLHLAQPQNGQTQPQGLAPAQAKVSASAIVGAWAVAQAPGAPGHAAQATADPASVPGVVSEVLAKAALHAGKRVLRGARLDSEDFSVGTIQPWADERAKFVLDSVDSTVRDEAQGFLEDQLQQTVDPATVSAAAKDHFADFPATHASLVGREEVKQAYNHGTLRALHSAGVSQVQAHDASDGRDQLTDSACQRRNGRVMSLDEATTELAHTHPRCTLYFTPLSTDSLSVERVADLPEHLSEDGLQAAYDDRSETLYVLDSVDEERERAYVSALGSTLALR